MIFQKRYYWKSMVGAVLFSLFSDPVFAANRISWVAADEMQRDYAPSFLVNLVSGNEFTEDDLVFVEEGIGRRYLKPIYRKYTEGLAAVKPRSPEKQPLVILGPVISATVSDQIIVYFKNNTRFPATSIHPHGVLYNKAHEGSLYNDGDNQKGDDIFALGNTSTYLWEVPNRVGPRPNDSSSSAWIYHRHVNEPADTNAGLIRPMIISKLDAGDAMVSQRHRPGIYDLVHRVFNENTSLYLDVNLACCS